MRLSPSSDRTVTVAYATSDDTATQPGDYTSESGMLTFTPGQTMMTISVPTIDDSDQESDERFRVTLSNPSGARLNQTMGEGTITDNDGGPHHAGTVHRKRVPAGRRHGPIRGDIVPGRQPDGDGGLRDVG